MKNRSIVAVLLFAFTLPSNAALIPTCVNDGFYIGYLNGVGATYNSSLNHVKRIQISLAFAPENKEPVQYDLLYNTTQGYATDLAEVFEQRAAERDSSGLLGQRYEYISADQGDLAAIPALTTAIDFIQQGYEVLMIKALAAISTLSRPITAKDYARHNIQLDTAITNGQKIMLISHSQGSLFLNHAYDYISPKISAGRLGINYIAPATPTLHGSYVLTSIDVVINGLRLLQGLNSAPDNNTPIAASFSDASGHGLLETYMDIARDGRKMVLDMINTALSGFRYPASTPTAAKTTANPVAVYTANPSDPLQGTFSHLYFDTPDEALCWAVHNR